MAAVIPALHVRRPHLGTAADRKRSTARAAKAEEAHAAAAGAGNEVAIAAGVLVAADALARNYREAQAQTNGATKVSLPSLAATTTEPAHAR